MFRFVLDVRAGKHDVAVQFRNVGQAFLFKGRVHVAIITIRLDEYEAMEERLGAVRAVVGNQIYKFAEISQKDGESVSVVLTRVVSQGNPSAYRAATDIIHRGSFHDRQ